MDKVYTLEEARSWFIAHHEPSVLCVRIDRETGKTVTKECLMFSDAEKFFLQSSKTRISKRYRISTHCDVCDYLVMGSLGEAVECPECQNQVIIGL